MDLLERYLQAVRTYLPKGQQDDIIKELSENLRSQIEDKEAEAGRPLNEDELAAILKRHGHPLIVATRYRQVRHLIGPTLFPFYLLVMKIILAIVGFGYAVAAIVLIAQGKPLLPILGALLSYVGAVLPTFAAVTIIFAVLDIGNSKFRLLERVTSECNEKFDPRELPPARTRPEDLGAKPISRAKTGFELFWSLAFLLWWVRVEPIRKLALFTVLGPVGLADKIPFQLGPVWHQLFVPVILISVAAIGQQIVMLIHPYWVKFYFIARLIVNGSSLILFYFVIRASQLLVMDPGTADFSTSSETLRIINLTLHYSMVIALVVTVFEGLRLIRQLIGFRSRAATAAAL
jgi:hypothetical protein